MVATTVMPETTDAASPDRVMLLVSDLMRLARKHGVRGHHRFEANGDLVFILFKIVPPATPAADTD
jgi:hypothetical protein